MISRTVYNVLVDAEPRAADVIIPVRVGIDLLPANIDLAAAEIEMVSAFSRESLLKDALQPLATGYDFVLIDCGPNLGLLTINALTAAGVVLIPLQCEYFALRALSALLKTVAPREDPAEPWPGDRRHFRYHVPLGHTTCGRSAGPGAITVRPACF